MKNFRRFLALLLCVMMVITSMPLEALADPIGGSGIITPVPKGPEGEPAGDPEGTDPEGEEPEAPAPTPCEEAFYELEYMDIFMKPYAKTDYIITSDMGDQFEYRGYITLQKQPTFEFTEQSKTTSLFTKYEDVTVWVKAPAGIILTDVSRNPLPLAGDDSEYPGYYALNLGDIDAPTTGSTKVDITNKIYAYMEGNGIKSETTFDAADVRVTAHTTLVKDIDPETEEYVYEDIEFVQSQITYDTAYPITGKASGKWTSDKYKNEGTGSDAVAVVGDDLILTFYIRVGAGENHNVSNQDNDFVRYGTIDLQTMVLKDNIAVVKNKYGVDTWPKSVKGYVGSTECGVYYDDVHAIVFDESTLNTIDASSVGIADPVKRGTTYKIVLVYDKNDFIYPASETNPEAFKFEDDMEFFYGLKDATFSDGEYDSEYSEWYDQAGGGNVKANSNIFLGEHATANKPYSTVYSSQFGFGTIGYDIYPLDEEGKEIYKDGEVVKFHIDLAEQNDGNGTTSTEMYTKGTSALKGKIPEGKVKVVADFSNLNSDMVVPVDSKNSTIQTGYETILDVKAGKTASLDVYLRYKLGGIVNVSKEYRKTDGTKDTKDLSAKYAATKFILTPKKGGNTVEVTLDKNGQGVAPIATGDYTVTEVAPDGFVSYVGEITIQEGDENRISNVGSALVNYPSKADITVNAYKVDQWVSGDYNSTVKGAAAYSDSGTTYQVEKLVNGSWVAVGDAKAPGNTVTVDRFNADGSAIEYRVRAINTDGKNYAGNVAEKSSSGMSDTTESVTFKFDNDDKLVERVDLFFLNTINVTVKKVVNDRRAAADKRSADGWTMTLTSSDATFEPLTGVTGTDGSATVIFKNLPKTDATGAYVTYTVAEQLPTGEDTLWVTTFADNKSTVKGNEGDKTITVTNTANVGELAIVKVDNANTNTKLKNVEFQVYATVDGSIMYVTDTKENGIRKLSASQSDAATFVTNTSGKITIDSVPSGYVYTAVETKAAENYYLLQDPAPLNGGKALPANTSKSTTIKNVKHPTLEITKHGYSKQTGALINYSEFAGAKITYELYTKDEDGNFVNVLDKDGKKITLSATCTSGAFSTPTLQLDKGGEYYIVETSVSNDKLVLPTDESSVAPAAGGYSNAHVIKDGKVFFGPFVVEDKDYKLTCHVNDIVNSVSVNIVKKNAFDGKEITVDNSGLKYRVATYLPANDALIAALKASGWSDDYQDDDFTEAAPTGSKWMVSPEYSTASCAVPVKNTAGRDLEYWVIETKAPDGFYNKIKANGSEGHNVAKAEFNSSKNNFTATLEDAPKAEVQVHKYLIEAADMSPVSVMYYQSGVTIGLYSVDKSGMMSLVTTKTTAGLDGAIFDGLNLDFSKYDYVAVELNSQGYDYKFEVSATDYSVNLNAADLDGMNIADIGSVNDGKGTNYYRFTKTDVADTDQDGVYSAETTFINHNPYIQLQFNKFSDDNKNGKKDAGEQPLDKCKFLMYVIPAADWASASGDEQTKAKALTADDKYTDGYVYETDTNGQFNTVRYDYNDQNVYVFKEIETKPGYILNEDLLVVDFNDYKADKNDIHSCEPMPNQPDGGEGPAFLRFIRVEVDKFADMDIDLKYTAGVDMALPGVTFNLHLVDKNKNVVVYDRIERFFTTGNDKEKGLSFATSETFFITEAFIAEINKIKSADDIFTFYNDGEEINYAKFVELIANEQYDKLEVSFGMVLEEDTSKLPPLTLPYGTNYYITVKTGEDLVDGTSVNKTWTLEKLNPVLNAYGNNVYAEVEKYTDKVGGTKWTPADASDYVEYTFKADPSKTLPSGEEAEFTVRVDSYNYDKRVLVKLVPGVKYTVYESHAPKGYDKPVKNYFEVPARELEIDPATGTIPVTAVQFADTPYVEYTFHKVDSEGKPVEGVKLQIYYSSGNKPEQVKDANFQVLGTDYVVLTTDEFGIAKVKLPRYDYRSNKDGTTSKYSTVTYRVIELTNGKRDTVFDALNGTKATFSASSNSKTIEIKNPEAGDISVTKFGLTDNKNPLEGVKFTLSFSPATANTLGSNKTDAYKTVPADKTFTTVQTDVTTDKDGKLNFTGLKSGWYKLVETIPADYMYEGDTYTVTFFYITPGDLTNMKALYGSSFWAKQSIYILSETISTSGANQGYCETTAEGTALEIINNGKAFLNVTKLFPEITIPTVTVPGSVTVTVTKDGATSGETKTITITDGKGSIPELYALEPGTYTVTETVNGSWVGAFSTDTAAGSTDYALMTKDGSNWKTTTFTVSAADTRLDPAEVEITNYPTAMQLKIMKVDSELKPIEGAEFELFEKKNGKNYYWSGQGWTTSESSAVKFVSGPDGLMNFEFTIDQETATLTDGALTGSYWLHETKTLEGLTLIADKEIKMTAGKVNDMTVDAGDYVVDSNGLTVKFDLIGHTMENAAKHEDDLDYIPGVTFALYKVTKNEAGEITSATKVICDDSMSNAKTDADGKGAFYFLEKLNENESYILVQTDSTDDYHGTDVYFDTSMGKTTLTEGSKTYSGVEVFTYASQETSSVANVHVFNMPKSYLLILKYDYEDPTAEPVNALFEADLVEGSSAYTDEGHYTPQGTTNTERTGITGIAAKVADYTYASGKFTDAEGTVYTYTFEEVLPGSYDVKETQQAAGYLYTPAAEETDPWYPVREGVVVGDDGNVAVVTFANVPVPSSNNVGVTKTTTASDGNGADGKLMNLQETKKNGSWQNVTYTISDFAPAPLNGEAQPYVKYPMSKLIVEDEGQNFKAGATAINNVESYVTSVTIGKANYVDAAVSTMNAAVFGINATEEKLLTIVNVASAAQTYKFPAKTYTGFKIVYNANTAGEPQALKQHFKAESITTNFEMLQGSDESIGLATKATNIVNLTMGYNIGVTDGQATITVDDDADIDIGATVKLPEGKLTKTASVNGGAFAGGSGVQIRGGDGVTYKLVFENKDTGELVIPNAFIADYLPKCIDIDTTTDTPFCTVTAYDASGAVDTTVTVGDIVYDKEGRYIYATTTGDLKAGGKLEMIINGVVNTATALDEYAGGITNKAYAGSTTVMPKNSANKNGAAFNVNGSPAAKFAKEIPDMATYAATDDQLSHKLLNDADITIMKEVAGSITGSTNYMSGSANVAVTESEGNVWYRVTVTTKNAFKAGEMRIADLLPYVGDTELNGSKRNSGFEVIQPTSMSVTVGGKSATYSVTYTDSRSYRDYQAALNNGAFASECGAGSAAGWMVTVNQSIKQNESVVITFICKAPKAIITDEAGKVTANNLFKRAINSASVSTPKTVGTGRVLTHSNLAYVSIIPDQKAAVGDRIWLDKNANGIQDKGEPDFTEAGTVQLRTFVGSDKNSTASAGQTTDHVYNWFTGLTTAMPLDDSGSEYSGANVTNAKLSGYTKTAYQLVVNGIPEGYLLTKQYAGNDGQPTLFHVEYDENGYLVYVNDNSDGRDVDSDFASDGNGKFVTRRFYLPIQSSTFPDVKPGQKVPEAVYPTFDMGVVRTRDLEITKKGAKMDPIEGVKFEIYGPYFVKPTGTPSESDLLTTIVTDKDGIASFKSTDLTSYLNYYAYYMVVEADAPKPYDTKMMLASGFESTTGNAVLTATTKSDTFILNPATDAQNVKTEKVSVKDEYTASGSVVIDASKAMTGANIEEDPFKTKFSFELKRNEEQGISDFEDASVTLTNNGAKIPSTTINYYIDEWLGEDGEIVFTYTMTEQSVDELSVITDPAEYVVTVKITDPDAKGELTVVKTVTKDGEEYTEDVLEFTNEYKTGDLSIEKAVVGTQANPNGDEFEFTVTLTPETADMGKMIYNKTFPVEIDTVGTKTSSSVKFDAKGVATIKLKDKQVATIKGLPVGTTADVTEKDYTNIGYATEVSGAEGIIIEDCPLPFVFTNTRLMGGLDVSKEVSGTGADADKAFEFTVTLTYANADLLKSSGNYPLVDNAPVASTAIKDNVVTIKKSIKHGEYFSVTNVLVGTEYKVVETSYVADGYLKTTVNGTETLEASGTITDTDNNVEIAYINTRDSGDLSIKKVLEGNATSDTKQFSFTVTLANANAPVAGTYNLTEGGTVKFVDAAADTGYAATATITLIGGETKTIENILAGSSWKVEEASYKEDGYDTEDGTQDGTIVSGEIAEAEITNIRNVGSLELTKEVVGTDRVGQYEFTIVLTYPEGIKPGKSGADNKPKIGSTAVGTVDGQTVTIVKTIAKDETLVIDNILYGTTYSITEKDYSDKGFNEPVIDKPTGTIDETTSTAVVKCTNTRDAVSLAISKTVSGNAGDSDKQFHFTVYLTNATVITEGKYPTTDGADVEFKATGKANHESKADIYLKDGQTVTITDIVKGTGYTVVEDNYDAEGYTTTKTGDTGTLDSAKTAEFTNKRIAGSLIVSKAVEGGGTEIVPAFEYTITLTYAEGITASKALQPVITTEGTVKSNTLSGNVRTIVVMLADKQDITISNVLVGTAYTVSEKDYSEQGFNQVKINGELVDDRFVEGKIEEEKQEITYAYTNVRNAGGLKISKVLEGNATEADRKFNFHIELTSTLGIDIARTYKTETDGVTVTFTAISGDKTHVQADIQLKGGESLTITQIPEGTTYIVTEENLDADDYDVTKTGDVGDIVNDVVSECEYTNTRNVGSIELSKTFSGDNNPVDKFEFTIVLTYEGDIDLTKTLNKPIYSKDEAAEVTIGSATKKDGKQIVEVKAKIPAGKKITISNILADTAYEITEKDYTVLGFLEPTVTGDLSGTIEADDKLEVTVAVENTREAGELSVEKILDGNAADLGLSFTFTVTLTNENGMNVANTYPATGAYEKIAFTKKDDTSATATFTLKGGEKVTITDIPVGTTYTVVEDEKAARKYDYNTTPDGEEGEITADPAECTFTNERSVGSIELEKIVSGSGKDNVGDFVFTITLTYEDDIDLAIANNKPTFSTTRAAIKSVNGNVVTIEAKLKNGESVEIKNILVDTVYTIVETDYTSYGFLKPTITGENEGTIDEEGKKVEVSYENTREAGELNVKKVLEGNAADLGLDFTFTVTLTNENGVKIDGDYEAEGKYSKITFTKKTDTTATATFTLKGGEEVTILDIPAGTTYSVAEDEDTARKYDYNTTPDGEEGEIKADTTSECTYTNERSIGSIELEKIVSGSGKDNVGTFVFTITLTYEDDIDLGKANNKPIFSATRAAIKAINGNVMTVEAKLKNGESVEIKNILVDTEYTIVETDYSSYGFLEPIITGDDEGIIDEEGKKVEVSFENKREAGKLNVKKVLEGNAADLGLDFTFTVTLTNENGVKIDGDYEAEGKYSKVTFTKKSDTTATATFTLKGGEEVTILDIPAGTTYSVVEDEDTARKYDYNTTPDGEEGEIKAETTSECTYTNERSIGSFSLTKTVTGGGKDLVGDFEFTIVLTYEEDIDLTKTDNKPTTEFKNATIKAAQGNTITITAKLKNGETLTIDNILVDTAYVITEKNYFLNGFLECVIDGNSVEVTDKDVVLSVEDAISAMAEADEHTFENVRKSGNLLVTKTPDGNAFEDDREFTFTVTLTNEKHVPVNLSYETVKTDAQGNETTGTITFTAKGDNGAIAETTFKLKGNESLLIKDILADTKYKVEEASARAWDYNTTPDNEENVIVSDETAECEYTNERSVGTIDLTKIVSGTGKDIVGNFEFTIVLTYEDDIKLSDKVNMPTTEFKNATINAAQGNTVTIKAVLKNGETLTIENVLVDTTYVITEKNYHLNGFLECIIDGTSVAVDSKDVVLTTEEDSISEEAEADTHTFENVRNAGPLTVKKTLDGNAVEYDHPFKFTVVLTRTDDVPLNLTYTTVKTDAEGNETAGTITFTNVAGDENKAQASFSICGSETFKIEDILTDTEYLVYEDDYQMDGYLTDETEFTGIIVDDGCEEEFINRRNYSDLIVAKKPAGNSFEYFRPFVFTVTLERAADRLPVNRTYPTVLTKADGTEVTGTITFVTNEETGKAEATFEIHGEETFKISEIYADSLYTVTEDYYGVYGYHTTSENEEGATDKDTPVTCTYTNERNTGTLTITKTVVAEGMNIPTEKRFEFTINLYRPNGEGVTANKPYEKNDGTSGTISFVNGVAKTTLKHGGSITIKDIQLDYTYVVTEKEYVNVETTSSGETGTITKDGCTADFTNTIKQVYLPITVIKVWADDDNADLLRPTYVTIVVKANGKEIDRFELNEACNWTKTLEDLPRYTEDGVEIVYSVDEENVPAKYYKSVTAKGTVITIKNTHNTPWDPDVPLAAGINLNEGYCFD